VAVIVNDGGVSAGTELGAGLRVRESIPQAHKVALRAIAGTLQSGAAHLSLAPSFVNP